MKTLHVVCQEWICGINYLMAFNTKKQAEKYIKTLPEPVKEDNERYFIEKIPYDNKKTPGN